MLTIELIIFAIGTIILYFAGKQDEKTRIPLLIMPAMILIGLAINWTTGLLIFVFAVLIFLSPKKINDLVGKADLFLFVSILIIFIFANNIFMNIFIGGTLAITIVHLIYELRKQKDLVVKIPIPLITYFSKSFIYTVVLFLIGIVITVMWVMLIG